MNQKKLIGIYLAKIFKDKSINHPHYDTTITSELLPLFFMG